ncbi:hypothetical protein HOY80DRAFT_987063 [Tuber brumale]|nr:hypothetical protein HOY80DRAFT_987063 [Tuber brumale]
MVGNYCFLFFFLFLSLSRYLGEVRLFCSALPCPAWLDETNGRTDGRTRRGGAGRKRTDGETSGCMILGCTILILYIVS